MNGITRFFTFVALGVSFCASPAWSQQEGVEGMVTSGSPVSVVVNVVIPEGFHLNPDAPSKLSAKWGSADSSTSISVKEVPVLFSLPPIPRSADRVEVLGTIYLCNTGPKGVCLIRPVKVEQNIEATSGTGHVKIEVSVALKGA